MLPISRRTFMTIIMALTSIAQRSPAHAARPATAGARAIFPSEADTGVPDKAALRPSGPIRTTRDSETIRDLDISGMVQIMHNSVTVENCRITAATFSVVTIANSVTGAVVRNCDINGVGSGNDGSCGISGHGTFTGNNIYNVENGMSLAGTSTLIERNYIHDLRASGSPHYDGIQIDGNVSDVIIRGNNIVNDHNQTSAIMIDNWAGPISNILIENNRLIGGSYTVYSDGRQGASPIANVSFISNRIAKGYYGLRAFSRNTPTWKGNINDDTGRPI